MRVWIVGSKRWGDSAERFWQVEWWGTPPVVDGENDIDAAPEYVKGFKTREAAVAFAKKAAALPDNYWALAHVQQYGLEEIEGSSWDWEPIGDCEEFVP